VLGGVADVAPIAAAAHGVGAKLLLDGCQAAPRIAVDVAALDCDFYCFSGHKLYGPTGIGVLWARGDLLDAMAPWQGGGAMIDEVAFERVTYAAPPQRFEAGTPHIVGAVGLHAAIRWVEQVGIDALQAHEAALTAMTRAARGARTRVRLLGPDASAGIISFDIPGIHPHDTATILDEGGVAIRAGHHCAQPLMRWLGLAATARASVSAHTNEADIDRLAAGIDRTLRIFA